MRVRRTPMLPSLPLGPRPPRGDDRVKGPVSSTRLATRKRAARSGYRATPSAPRPPRSGLVQRPLFGRAIALACRPSPSTPFHAQEGELPGIAHDAQRDDVAGARKGYDHGRLAVQNTDAGGDRQRLTADDGGEPTGDGTDPEHRLGGDAHDAPPVGNAPDVLGEQRREPLHGPGFDRLRQPL